MFVVLQVTSRFESWVLTAARWDWDNARPIARNQNDAVTSIREAGTLHTYGGKGTQQYQQ